MNGAKVTYQDNNFIVNDNIYEFSYDSLTFLLIKYVLHGDDIEEDETIIKRFLLILDMIKKK